MLRQIGLLTKLEMHNFWGINVWLHTVDKKVGEKITENMIVEQKEDNEVV